MRIDQITFRNFNCFEHSEHALAPGFNLVIGDNGAGKTTILDGLAVGLGALFLGFPHPAVARSIHRDEVRLAFYRQGSTWTAEPQTPAEIQCRGFIAGHDRNWSRELTNLTGRTTRQNAKNARAIGGWLHRRVKAGDESVVLPLISYYGTGRLWVQIKDRKVETLKPDTRFMGYLDCLNPASNEKRLIAWFKTQEISAIQQRAPIPVLEACRRAILACVPDATNVVFDVARDELMLTFSDRELPFTYLSDGYRNMLAMAADIAVRCATLNPGLGLEAAQQTPGVVLVDEIDLHLHPKWQRRVVDDLMRAFPLIQFVATTHSPFVIQSLRPSDNVRLINLDDPDAAQIENRSIEDITEDVQKVEVPQRSQRYLDMMHAAEGYYRLLRESPNASPDEKMRLSKRLDELILPFSDDPAYQALLRTQREAAGLGGGQEA